MNYPQIDNILYSRHLSGWYCIDTVRRKNLSWTFTWWAPSNKYYDHLLKVEMQSPAQEKMHNDPRVFILNLLPWIHHVSLHKIIATLKSIFIWIFFRIIKSYHVSIQVLQKQWTQDRITSAFWSMHIQHSSMLESSEATSSTLWTKKMCKVN